MTRQYNVEENGTIWYTENGQTVSFAPIASNADYQRYLRWLENPDAEEGGTL